MSKCEFEQEYNSLNRDLLESEEMIRELQKYCKELRTKVWANRTKLLISRKEKSNGN